MFATLIIETGNVVEVAIFILEKFNKATKSEKQYVHHDTDLESIIATRVMVSSRHFHIFMWTMSAEQNEFFYKGSSNTGHQS